MISGVLGIVGHKTSKTEMHLSILSGSDKLSFSFICVEGDRVNTPTMENL